LRLLRSPTDLDDVILEVPPQQGTLLAFRRSHNSYHGHKQFSGPRRVIHPTRHLKEIGMTPRRDEMLGWTHPDLARFLLGAGLDVLDTHRGLAPRALRDIKIGQAAGR